MNHFISFADVMPAKQKPKIGIFKFNKGENIKPNRKMEGINVLEPKGFTVNFHARIKSKHLGSTCPVCSLTCETDECFAKKSELDPKSCFN